MNKNKGDCIDIDQQIQAFAKQRRIRPEDFQAFRDSILNGLRMMKLRTDTIELEKFKKIAGGKKASEIAKQNEVELCQSKEEGQ